MSKLDIHEVTAVSLVDVPAVEEFAIAKRNHSHVAKRDDRRSFARDAIDQYKMERGEPVAKSAHLSDEERHELLEECAAIEAGLKQRDGNDEPLLKRLAAVKKSLEQPGRKGRATQTDGTGYGSESSDAFAANALKKHESGE